MTQTLPKEDAGLATALRAPLQGRSRESYERMLQAAEELLASSGSPDVTLTDVSKRGKVSIGSIYNRFKSKEALIHAVQLRVLERADGTMKARMQGAIGQATDLDDLVVRLVEVTAETWREYGDLLRPFMLLAPSDPRVAATGRASYGVAASAFSNALIKYRGEIRQPDPERAIRSSFRVLYSAIARYLGFGAAAAVIWEGDWDVLKEDLARMLAAFLRTPPKF